MEWRVGEFVFEKPAQKTSMATPYGHFKVKLAKRFVKYLHRKLQWQPLKDWGIWD